MPNHLVVRTQQVFCTFYDHAVFTFDLISNMHGTFEAMGDLKWSIWWPVSGRFEAHSGRATCYNPKTMVWSYLRLCVSICNSYGTCPSCNCPLWVVSDPRKGPNTLLDPGFGPWPPLVGFWSLAPFWAVLGLGPKGAG